MLELCAVSLLVDLVVHVLVDVVVVALPLLWTADVLGNPNHGCSFCDGNDDLDVDLIHHWAR